MNDFLKLNSELSFINNHYKNTSNINSLIQSYFKSTSKSFLLYLDSQKKSLSILIQELTKQDTEIYDILLKTLLKSEIYLDKLKEICVNLDKDTAEANMTFNKFYLDLTSSFTSELKAMSLAVNDSQNLLEKSKNKYFDSCRQVLEQEKLSMRLASFDDENGKENEKVKNDLSNLTSFIKSKSIKKFKSNVNDLSVSIETLSKLKFSAETMCEQYKSQIEINKKAYIEYENKYKDLKFKIFDLEERRMIHIKSCFDTFSSYNIDLMKMGIEKFLNMNTAIKEIDYRISSKNLIKSYAEFNMNPNLNSNLKYNKDILYLNYDDYISRKNEDKDYKHLLVNSDLLINHKSENGDSRKSIDLNGRIRNSQFSRSGQLSLMVNSNDKNKIKYIRFPYEEFYNFDIIKRNLKILKTYSKTINLYNSNQPNNSTAISNGSSYMSKEVNKENSNLVIDGKKRILNTIDYFFISKSNDIEKEEYIINEVESIFHSEELVDKSIENIYNIQSVDLKLYSNIKIDGVDRFLLTLLNIKRYKVKLTENLNVISNIYNTIFNNEGITCRLFEILKILINVYAIIDNKSQLKVYFHNINTTIRNLSTSTWIDSINIILNQRMNFIIYDLLQKNIISNSVFVVLQQKTSIFKNTIKENKSIEETIKICKYLEDIKEYEIFLCLSEFIQIKSSFDIDITQSIEIIREFSKFDLLSKENSDFLVCFLNSNLFSVKTGKQFFKKQEKSKIAEKTNNLLINKGNNQFNLNVNTFYLVILYSYDYLNLPDLNKLSIVNKEIFKFIKTTLYQSILSNYQFTCLSTFHKKRIQIWKFLLRIRLSFEKRNYKKRVVSSKISSSDLISCLITNEFPSNDTDKLYSKINLITDNTENIINDSESRGEELESFKYDNEFKTYNDILVGIENDKSKDIKRIYDIINLDVLRSFYSIHKDDIEKMRMRLNNILKALSYTTEISYCQGMNYVGSFIIMITESEEEAFSLFYLLLQASDYNILFEKELFNLKKYFYIYERLIEILLPEIYLYFKQNSINVSFFCSSWFITLFTSFISSIDTIPYIIFSIWDEFIFHGWRSIIKLCLLILKMNEESILSFKYEESLHFLLNKIQKGFVFDNDNFHVVLDLFMKVEVSKEMFSNLENEYELKMVKDKEVY